MPSNPQLVFVAGATGALGRHIAPALQARGHRVTCGSRDAQGAARQHPEQDWARFDVDDVEVMRSALRGHDTLVFLVHRMDGQGHLIERETRGAKRVARAAAAAGISRIVYMGAVQPNDGTEPSPHILARALTGDALRGGEVPVIELQGSMVICAESESWRIVRDLAVRLPVMVLPAWLQQPTRPIGVRDVAAAFVHATERDIDRNLTADLPGPELLSVKDILVRTASLLGRRPLMMSVPMLSPKLSAGWIHAVTRADAAIADHLVEGMLCDVRGSWPGYWADMPDHTLQSFDEASRAALEACDPPGTVSGRMFEQLAEAVALPG